MIFVDINEPRSSKSPPVNVKGRQSQLPRQSSVKHFDNRGESDEDGRMNQSVVQEVDANLEQTVILN